MRFHYPSFVENLYNRLPETINALDHRGVFRLYSGFPVRREWITDQVIESVIQSYETPHQTPDQTEQQSLIKGLLDTQDRTLRQALRQTDRYLKLYRMTKARGEVEGYEYKIDINALEKLCIDAIAYADKKIFKRLLTHEKTASVRLMQKTLIIQHGKVYSKSRINRVLQVLEKEGFLNMNGGRRIYGREVMGVK